jgi:predicted phosphodiesterase
MKSRAACGIAVLVVILSSCTGIRFGTPADRGLAFVEPAAPYPSARFAVFSDPHLYDVNLGIEGAAFQRDMDSDRKLLPESREILSAALRKVRDMGVDFLLIPGDLTKDGERQDHLLMAEELSALSRAGVRIYVVPGNHDILNPHAVRYSGESVMRVPNVTPVEFAEIYHDAGYGEALFRDPESLSYVAEPVPGLWLLAVDSADYAGNSGRTAPETGSGLTPERVAWIESMLGQALRRQKAVIVMMHHGIVEHFAGQARYFSSYLVKDWQRASDMLASYGVRVVFTGHFHAQDIALRHSLSGRVIYDVETGSLVTFPDALRLVTIDAGTQLMRIESSFIRDLPSFSDRGIDFWGYSSDFVHAGTARIAVRTLKAYGISGEEASTIAAQITDAFAAHFRGDEHFTGSEMIRTRGLSPLAGIIVGMRKDLIASLWNDTEPPDNNLVIDLAAGTWEQPTPPSAQAPPAPLSPSVLFPPASPCTRHAGLSPSHR